MKKILLFVFMLVFSICFINASSLTVTIKDNQGNPIQTGFWIAEGFGVSFEDLLLESTEIVVGPEVVNSLGQATVSLNNGDYSLIAGSGGYSPKSIDVTISGSDLSREITLEETALGKVIFSVSEYVQYSTDINIEGAKVEIGGNTFFTNSQGITETIELEEGTYSTTFSKEGYETHYYTAQISAGITLVTGVWLDKIESTCTQDWECTSWSDCANRQMTRTCTDVNDCANSGAEEIITKNKPDESFPCEITCIEKWECVEWGACTNEEQTRTCTDTRNCANSGADVIISNPKPYESRNCFTDENCIEQWGCGSWSDCENGEKTRTCTDFVGCGTISNKPSISKSCTQDNADETDTSLETKIYIGNEEVSVERDAEGENIINVGKEIIKTNLELLEMNRKLYIKNSEGKKTQIKVLPEEAIEKAPKIENIDEIRITTSKDETVYSIIGTKNAKLFFMIPVLAEVEQRVSIEDGELISTKKPWWSFLASGI